MAERGKRLIPEIALVAGALTSAAGVAPVDAAQLLLDAPEHSVRIATFNADLNRKGAGVLAKDIVDRDPQVLNVAEIVLRARPDILLINEIDHDPGGVALSAFRDLLRDGVNGLAGLDYAHLFAGPVNTGVPSGHDLDGDGRVMGARDALGFGRFPGQYGMAILSTFPIAGTRTFQNFRWADVPWARAPAMPDGRAYYSPEAWQDLPFSSKSHWDVAVSLPDGRALHLLASHPTPPVFDGPEDRNGLRNAAEILFWVDYIDGAAWIADDSGQRGGLEEGAAFVVLGDLNNDPEKGDGDESAIRALLMHEQINDPMPTSPGAEQAGDLLDTADWPDVDGPGNLRVDYVLPSADLKVVHQGVFWPEEADPLHDLVAIKGRKRSSSDHRLVWIDVRLGAP